MSLLSLLCLSPANLNVPLSTCSRGPTPPDKQAGPVTAQACTCCAVARTKLDATIYWLTLHVWAHLPLHLSKPHRSPTPCTPRLITPEQHPVFWDEMPEPAGMVV